MSHRPYDGARLIETLNRSRWTFLAALVISGVLFAFGFADFDLPPLAIAGLSLAMILFATRSSARKAFGVGWLWGAVVWLINVPWVIPVMSKYGGLSKPVGIAIFIAMAFYVGVNGGIFAAIAQRLVARLGTAGWLLLPVAWGAEEFFRARYLPSFPWNPTAVMLIDVPSLVLPVQLTGPFFVATLFAIFPALFAWMAVARPARTRAIVASATATAIVLIWSITGWAMAQREYERIERETKDSAALLQPNVTQEQRWDPSQHARLYFGMMQMTEDAMRQGARVVIWPESAVPLTYLTTDFFRKEVETLTADFNADIILGSVAYDPADETKVWNAAYLVHRGETKGRYDKIRLVPFGEYVPFREVIFFAKKLVRNVGEFQRGTNDRPLEGHHRYGPAICYEIVFPEIVYTQVRNGANVLVTITNDAWFDRTSAPRQHLNMARLRAVEANRYLLRAATTGISAMVDPAGRITESLPLMTAGTILGKFARRSTVTPYVRYGDVYGYASMIVIAVALFWRRRPGERRSAG